MSNEQEIINERAARVYAQVGKNVINALPLEIGLEIIGRDGLRRAVGCTLQVHEISDRIKSGTIDVGKGEMNILPGWTITAPTTAIELESIRAKSKNSVAICLVSMKGDINIINADKSWIESYRRMPAGSVIAYLSHIDAKATQATLRELSRIMQAMSKGVPAQPPAEGPVAVPPNWNYPPPTIMGGNNGQDN